jgi:hypothetical protein
VFKVCARCGQEYQSWATECTDCHVPLDLAPGETLASGEALAPEDPGPVTELEDLVLLGVGEPWKLQALAQSLSAHGLPSRIDTHPLGERISGSARIGSVRLGIYVDRRDLAAAQEIAARDIPDAGQGESFSDPGVCPACGEPTPEDAAACAACALEFPEVPAEDRT